MALPLAGQQPSDIHARLIDALFARIRNGQVDDDTLLQLNHVLGSGMIMPALTLVDKGEVVRIQLPGGRSIYQVTSSTGRPYTVHPTPSLRRRAPYCPCLAYQSGVLLKEEQYMCKHVVAVMLAERLGRYKETRVDRAGVAALLGLP